MSRLKQVPHHIGTHDIDYFNIYACLILAIYNIINLLIKEMSLFSWFIYLTPYVIYPIIQPIIKKRIITAFLYLLVGLFTIALDPLENGATGLLFIFLSYNEVKNIKWLISLAILSFISLSIRLIILNTNGSDAIVSILMFVFMFATLYFKVIDHRKQRIDVWKELSEKEKAILKLYMRGYDYAKISRVLNLTDKKESIRTIITRVRIKSECENDIQFGIWLSEKG